MRHKTEDGWLLVAYKDFYLDFGLAILKDDKVVFDSPCALSIDCYGYGAPDGMLYEEALDEEALVEWTDEDWQHCLESEADSLIEALVDPVHWMSPEDHEAHLKALS